MNIFSIYIYTCPVNTQTDLGLRCRTFSPEINTLPTFSEITQAWHCLRNVFIQLDEFTY